MSSPPSSQVPGPRRTGQPALLDSDPERFSFWAWNDVGIYAWYDVPTRDALFRLQKVAEPRIEIYPDGLSDVHLVRGRVGLPDHGTREALVRLSSDAANHLAAVAIVLGGEGFWASTIRSLVTGIRLLVPGRFAMTMCGSTEEVAEWLPDAHAKRTGRRMDPMALKRALDFVDRHDS
jgi:hypothetical protein